MNFSVTNLWVYLYAMQKLYKIFNLKLLFFRLKQILKMTEEGLDEATTMSTLFCFVCHRKSDANDESSTSVDLFHSQVSF